LQASRLRRFRQSRLSTEHHIASDILTEKAVASHHRKYYQSVCVEDNGNSSATTRLKGPLLIEAAQAFTVQIQVTKLLRRAATARTRIETIEKQKELLDDCNTCDSHWHVASAITRVKPRLKS